jgi:hypothetical protein
MAATPATCRYRAVGPDGRRGRWHAKIESAVRAAASERFSNSDGTLRIVLDLRASLAMWASMKVEGWHIECQRRA